MKLIMALLILAAMTAHADEKTSASQYPTSPNFQRPKNVLVTPPAEKTSELTGGNHYSKEEMTDAPQIKEKQYTNTGDYNNQRVPIDPKNDKKVTTTSSTYSRHESCEVISGKLVCDKMEQMKKNQKNTDSSNNSAQGIRESTMETDVE